MRKKVYFVRHGQSVGNVDGRFHGPEVPLTEHGEKQARFVAERCRELDFDVIVSSTMERARKTADYIRQLSQKPIEFTDDLVERKEPTELLGKHGSDPEADAMHRSWTESFFMDGYRVGDGENFADMRDRARRVLKDLKGRGEKNIVAVTHGFFLRMILAEITFGEALTPENFKSVFLSFRTTNTGITFIESTADDVWYPWMSGRSWIVRAWNDYAHLGDSARHE